ncbi:serine/threonine protein kinase [Ktedonospora formicarum]|uniref:non-specific serine/threonine protein kinase n=1 Tax=Ktedonospora formicarum TaxID=2778364 RepID=A0A8J3I327_9CHLR|nr:serine/threonine-protein kinase [Ktedonospora formicarum]GHO45322.1 hypothetical protein KSX_34850 [Ktedonospora formicarum]
MTVARGQHLIGKQFGSCVLEQVLGYGGSSAVFLAQQHDPERKVAVKVFLPRQNMDRQMLREYYDRFLHEAEVASSLDHPHILPIYAYGEQDGLPYIIMPHMSGGTLAQYISKRGALSLQETHWYLAQIAQALEYTHEQGWVHCDVKPANILLDDEGHAMLSDFGISRKLATRQQVTDLERDGNSEMLMGTPDYISPEQAMGRVVDGRSDVYSLGITLFYVLTEQLPFKADSTIALALLHIHEEPPLPGMIRKDVKPAVDEVIKKALEKAPEERFQNVEHLSEAFAAALAVKARRVARRSTPSRSTPSRSTPSRRHGRQSGTFLRGSKRSHRGLLLGGTLLVLLLVSTVISLSGVLMTYWPSASLASPRLTGGKTPQATLTQVSDLFAERTQWPLSQSFFFDTTGAQYHIVNTSPQEVPLISLYQRRNFDDFRLDISMQEVRNSAPNDGGDFYGVILRSDAAQSHYYLFEVLTSDIGQYIFLRYDSTASQKWTSLASGLAPMLRTGMGNENKLRIDAQGNSFSIAINGHSLGDPIKDQSSDAATAPKSGQIGLYVEEQGMEVAFSHLQVTASTETSQVS